MDSAGWRRLAVANWLILMLSGCGGPAPGAAWNRLEVLAGVPSSLGSSDGSSGEARFNYPWGVAADQSGNVYVADCLNGTIRKITPAGVVTTLAGTAGSEGSADGTGTAARFNYPWGVAVDRSGNVYVADTNNSTVRKISPAGTVTTLAGKAGCQGGSDGAGATARFVLPSAVAVDGSGNVYVADNGNQAIRKVTPEGTVTTLAGKAGGHRFIAPAGVAVDGSGNVYVADSGDFTIQKITPAGLVSTLAGTAGSYGSADGIGVAAQFNFPWGVAVDGSGDVYVTDANNHTIRNITPAGFVTTPVGVPGLGRTAPGPLPAALHWPEGLAWDPATGSLLITADSAVLQVTR